MTVPFLDVRASYEELEEELKGDFVRVMSTGWYILGDEVDTLEQEFARFCGARHAVAVGNGLDALAIALRASGVGPGDEVIVPAHTFIATWLAVARVGATIVPVDVDPTTSLIDPSAAASARTSRTAAIVPVHLYGHPVDVSSLRAASGGNTLFVLEDAAQAHGAKFGDRHVGALGDAAGFSFYPTKNLGAFGDAGAVTTDDHELAIRAGQLRNYGSRAKYDFVEVGENSRLDPLQAAFLRTKLRVLGNWNARRAEVAERYLRELAGLPEVTLPPRGTPAFTPAWHIFCIRHPRRDELREHLAARGIETLVHYPLPPHLSPAFADLGYAKGSFPAAEAAATTGLSLPLGPHLGPEAVAEVIEGVATFATR